MIRNATNDDAQEISRLCSQLGYPASANAIEKRLSVLLPVDSHHILVSEEDGTLTGWIHGGITTSVEYDTAVEILGLVVDEDHRRKGIAKALVDKIVNWAKENNFPRVRVRSNLSREASHIFYKKLGFSEVKKQQVYDLLLQ